MSIVKKTVKFVEEKENTKNKKMHRSKERNTKYAEPGETKVIEEPPQHETQFEYKCSKDPLYQSTVTERRTLFKPIQELEVEITQPSVHYKQGEGEGWESDCDGWFD
jgi:hypothetical protein